MAQCAPAGLSLSPRHQSSGAVLASCPHLRAANSLLKPHNCLAIPRINPPRHANQVAFGHKSTQYPLLGQSHACPFGLLSPDFTTCPLRIYPTYNPATYTSSFTPSQPRRRGCCYCALRAFHIITCTCFEQASQPGPWSPSPTFQGGGGKQLKNIGIILLTCQATVSVSRYLDSFGFVRKSPNVNARAMPSQRKKSGPLALH